MCIFSGSGGGSGKRRGRLGKPQKRKASQKIGEFAATSELAGREKESKEES